MATGNMFLGGARGSVGDITLSVQNGQQTYRQRNRQPRNPRSRRQMFQRASFAVPVKFFTRGTQQLFKFAFTDKKQTESDYNAFMRANAKRGILMTKEQLENPYIANLGRFQLTKGDLPSIRVMEVNGAEVGDGSCVFIKTEIAVASAPTTFGQLSQAILDSNSGYQRGDIITTLCIVTNCGYMDVMPYLVTDGIFEPRWVIEQMILDPDDTTALTPAWTCSKTSDGYLAIANANAVISMEIFGASVIVSRNSANGLRVSNSSIHPCADAAAVIAKMTPDWENIDLNDPWVAYVLASWGASEEAILQGSMAPTHVVLKPVISQVCTTSMCSPVGSVINPSVEAGDGDFSFFIKGENLESIKSADITMDGEKSGSFNAPEFVYDQESGYKVMVPFKQEILAEGSYSLNIYYKGSKICTVAFTIA